MNNYDWLECLCQYNNVCVCCEGTEETTDGEIKSEEKEDERELTLALPFGT